MLKAPTYLYRAHRGILFGDRFVMIEHRHLRLRGASFLGSEGEMHLNKPIVGIADIGGGNDYWSVASDGGIFGSGP